PDCWPLWSSDGWEPYLFALTLVFAVLIHFIKGKGPGRPKESQVAPDPRVRYGQVIKQRPERRLVSVTRRVVFGVAELIPPGANLDLALGAPERDGPPTRCAVASQDTQFRQAPDSARYADAAFQKLLQSVPEARFIERQDACTSCRAD